MCSQLVNSQCNSRGCVTTKSLPETTTGLHFLNRQAEIANNQNEVPFQTSFRSVTPQNVDGNIAGFPNNQASMTPRGNVKISTVRTINRDVPEFTENERNLFRTTATPHFEGNFPEHPNGQRTQVPETTTTRAPSQAKIYFPGDIDNLRVPSETFDAKLFKHMSAVSENLCFSPLSLQIILTFICTLSAGKLNDELSVLLDLPSDHAQVALAYEKLTRLPENSDMNNTVILANKIYYNQRYGPLKQSIGKYAMSSFATEVDSLNVQQPIQAADTINSWVSEKTRQLINNIVTPDSLNSDTSALLINSLYFKSEWENKFSTYDTEPEPFYVSSKQQVLVDMMNTDDTYRYGEFENLGAKVVEMPYKLNNFSMMIILPNEIDGLAAVQERLTNTSLRLISHRLSTHEVTIKLPKFKIDFDVDMVDTLKRVSMIYLSFKNVLLQI